MQNSQFDTSYFNQLPLIEEAAATVGQDWLAKLALLAPVFRRYNLQNHWGVALLHKHWEVREGELPVQEEYAAAWTRCYVTLPSSAVAGPTVVPSLLSLAHLPTGKLRALEYTTTVAGVERYRLLQQRPDFLAELYTVLQTSELHNSLGLIQAQEVAVDYRLVEESPDGRLSVLTERKAVDLVTSTQPFIQTSWFFSADHQGTLCSSHCGRACLIGE